MYRHINVTTNRGTITVLTSSESPNISVSISQTVLDEGSMSGLSSNAVLNDDGLLDISSLWNDRHGECAPDDPLTEEDCETSGACPCRATAHATVHTISVSIARTHAVLVRVRP